MEPLTRVRPTPLRRALGRWVLVAAVAAGVAVSMPAAAVAAPAASAARVSEEVADRRPVVLTRIVDINTQLVRAKVEVYSAHLPVRTTRSMTRAITKDQSTLAVAAVRTVTARTMPQLDGAAALAESVAPEPADAPDAGDLTDRADAVLARVGELRPDLQTLDDRATAGESWGFDVSAWADPARAGLSRCDEAESLAQGVLDRIAATGSATAQDEADVDEAESLAAEASDLADVAWTVWQDANGS